VTCTRKAAQQVNELAAEVLVGKRHVLAELPAEFDANTENYDAKGKLRTDRKPIPSQLQIRKGLRVHLTRNCDKAGDFVNGMECVVKAWDDRSRCLHVETVTGKAIAVFQYTDPNPEAQNVSFFPIRLGYASTIYKMQGAELAHVTIYLDRPGQKAAAYVAMSRVKNDRDYLFGGHYTKKHFVPNV
jgi:ATP-dependent exoDNAse (exonuclease V) alpha subunit